MNLPPAARHYLFAAGIIALARVAVNLDVARQWNKRSHRAQAARAFVDWFQSEQH